MRADVFDTSKLPAADLDSVATALVEGVLGRGGGAGTHGAILAFR